MVTIIVAYNERFLIGDSNGRVPWHIKEDLAFFKKMTVGHSVVMGRKTWESIPQRFRPLPDRFNVVVTSCHRFFRFPPGSAGKMAAVETVETALSLAKQFSKGDVYVTGGGQVYDYCIKKNLADVVMASEVKGHADAEGTTFFPDLKALGWTGVVFAEFDEFNVVNYLRPHSLRSCT